ncbi:MAG: gliding motility-associated C-terminal domain-containing protein, partial [Bacteroidota bacterium]|nr:gliding motility-associated C-terminal domain-containing protein [Bacteroidota bacterium]
YLWNFGDSLASPGNPDSSVNANPSHRYSAAADYQVRLKLINKMGCQDSVSKLFTVNGAVPKAGFTIENPSGLCSNVPLHLVNSSSVDFGSITKIQLFWGDTTGVSTIDNYPGPGKVYAHHYPDPVSGSPAQYSIRMIAYSGISCQQAMTGQVTIQAAPHIQYTPISSVCDNLPPFDISGSATVADLQGSFAYYGSGVSAAGSFNPRIAGAGMDTVYYAFKATNNCVDSGFDIIHVFPSPVVDAGPDLYVFMNDTVTIEARATGEGLTYLWFPSTFLNNNSLLTPLCTPATSVLYTLTVRGIGGCTSNSKMMVKILPPPLIPNAFSPNGDGVNDSWIVRNLDLYPQCDVSVYNRFGQIVFHSIGYKKPWDGTFNGQPAPVGVYVYVIKIRKLKKPFAGTLTLLR